MTEAVRMTFKELAERLGMEVNSARIKAKRRKWRVIPGNHPADPALVEVPIEFLEGGAIRAQGRLAQDGATGDNISVVKALEAHLDTLREQLEEVRTDRATAISRLEQEMARERARADQYQNEAAAARKQTDEATRQVSATLERLAAAQGEHKEAIKRFEAELEEARQPWWRRLMRR